MHFIGAKKHERCEIKRALALFGPSRSSHAFRYGTDFRAAVLSRVELYPSLGASMTASAAEAAQTTKSNRKLNTRLNKGKLERTKRPADPTSDRGGDHMRHCGVSLHPLLSAVPQHWQRAQGVADHGARERQAAGLFPKKVLSTLMMEEQIVVWMFGDASLSSADCVTLTPTASASDRQRPLFLQVPQCSRQMQLLCPCHLPIAGLIQWCSLHREI